MMTGCMTATHLRPPSCITALYYCMYPCLYIRPCHVRNLPFFSCIMNRVIHIFHKFQHLRSFSSLRVFQYQMLFQLLNFGRSLHSLAGGIIGQAGRLYNVACTLSVSSILNILSDDSVFRFDRSWHICLPFAAYYIANCSVILCLHLTLYSYQVNFR